MQYTPRDILNYVYEKELDKQFLLATANHVQDFSIGEITDKKIEKRGEDFYLVSKSYHLDIKITDDEVLTAAINGLYISAFISRKDDNYRVHFLVHQYPDQMKARFEEEITKDVVDYMIYGTIMALRLDTPEKVNACLKQILIDRKGIKNYEHERTNPHIIRGNDSKFRKISCN